MASYVRSGDDFLISEPPNSRTTNSEAIPVTLADGRSFIYWLESYNDGYGYQAQFVRGQEVDAGGHAVNGPITVHAETEFNGYISSLSVTYLSGGGYVLTWDERISSGMGYRDDYARAQIFDGNGQPVGEAIEIDMGTGPGSTYAVRDPVSIALEDGGFASFWIEGSGTLAYRAFNESGVPSGPENILFAAGDEATSVSALRSIDLEDGSSLIFWTTRNGSEVHRLAQLVDADGAPSGTVIELPVDLNYADIAAQKGGGFVVAWAEDSAIKTQIFDSSGSAVTGEMAVTPHQEIEAPRGAKIAALADGGYVVVWISNEVYKPGWSWSGNGYRNGDVLAQVFGAEGNTVDELIRVNSDRLRTQTDAQVEATADGGFIVTWREPRSNGIEDRIEAHLFRPGDPPVAHGDQYTVETSGVLALDIDGVLSNDDQPRNYDLTAYTDSQTKHGTLFLERNGALTYVPDEGFIGTDKFRYIANDGNANSTPVTVTIIVTEDEVFDRPVREGTEVGERLVRPDNTGWRLEGLGGNDTLVGGYSVADILIGGEGNDKYEVNNGGTRVVESAGEGYDIVWASDDFRVPDHIEETRLTGTARVLIGSEQGCLLIGNEQDNVIIGGDGNDEIVDNYGNDRLVGGTGNDSLNGASHSDNLRGGDGDDTLVGGGGQDFVRGGAGADVFKFLSHWDFATKARDNNADRIIDFSQSEGDRIDLSEINGDEEGIEFGSFVFRGTAGFSGRGITGTPGEIYFVSGVRTFLVGDVDGDRRADFVLRFDERVTLTEDDFIL